MSVPDADRFLVVRTDTEEVLSRWDTLAEAERALRALPPAKGRVGVPGGGAYPYAVADAQSEWRRPRGAR